ncbi:MAG: hypothetical protein WBC91_06395, partial [Phototrophicaceae bacterium]
LTAGGIAAMIKVTSRSAGCSSIVSAHQFRIAGAQAWSLNPDVAPVDTQNKLNHANFESTKIYYARKSKRVGLITESHQFLPADIAADLTGKANDGLPSNIVPFPKFGGD